MEFVHRHEAHIGMGAFAQSLIGEDFGGAADDRRVRVDVAVTGDHADIVAATSTKSKNFSDTSALIGAV